MSPGGSGLLRKGRVMEKTYRVVVDIKFDIPEDDDEIQWVKRRVRDQLNEGEWVEICKVLSVVDLKEGEVAVLGNVTVSEV